MKKAADSPEPRLHAKTKKAAAFGARGSRLVSGQPIKDAKQQPLSAGVRRRQEREACCSTKDGSC